MKKTLKLFTALFLSLMIPLCSFGKFDYPALAAPARTLNVLAIGNSFSEDATRHLYQIATDLGATQIVIGNLYISGCSIATHWSNAQNNNATYSYQKNSSGSWTTTSNTTMLNGIKDENWDVITIQQVSGYSGLETTYNSDITNLISYINNHKTNTNAKIAWHMTWAYQANSTHGDFARYNNNQMTMYNAIVSAVKNKIITNSLVDLVIPSGTAIQNARTSRIGDTLTRDGYHLSLNLGRYIAGLTWIKAITGWSIDNINWVPNSTDVPQEYMPLIKEAVNNAINTPYSVTESTYQTNPNDYSLYKQLNWEPTGKAYWNSTDSVLFSQLINAQNSTATNLKYFVSSGRMFTKQDIPIGSVIVIDSGYQYRPEAWVSLERQSVRPDLVTAERVVVDDIWWGNYTYRAFNVSVLGNTTDISNIVAETASHFRIYLPKSDKKTISEFVINQKASIISDDTVTLNLPAGTDVKSLVPSIQVSEKATISPASDVAQDFTNPVSYTVTAEDGTTHVYTVTVKIATSSAVTSSEQQQPPETGSNIQFILLLLSVSGLLLFWSFRKIKEHN